MWLPVLAMNASRIIRYGNNHVIITVISMSCGLSPKLTVVAAGCEYPLCDLINILATGQNDLWRSTAAKVCFCKIIRSPKL